MATTAAPVSRRALQARSIAEAFRITAEDFPDRVAVRTKDDEISITWGELRERVDALAGGLAALGVRARRHRRADALQPARVPPRRPRGDEPRRGAVLDLPDLGARADRLRRAGRGREGRDRRGGVPRRSCPTLEHIVVLEGARGEGTLAWSDVEGSNPGFDVETRLARGRARGPADADLHVGHHRAAEGRPARAPQPARGRREHRADDPVPRRRARSSRGCRRRTSPSARPTTTCRSSTR